MPDHGDTPEATVPQEFKGGNSIGHTQIPIKIKITHTVMVDICIAQEIENLNNDLGVSTEFSCCGGGYKRSAFVKVLEKDILRMKELGYIQKAPKSEPEFFKVKSQYKCTFNRAKRECITKEK